MTIINFLYCVNKANKRWWWWYLGINHIFLLLSLNIITIIFTIIIIFINISFNVITIMGMITFIIINPVCVKIFSFFFFVVVQAFSICRPDSLRRNSSCGPKDWVFKCKYQSPHTREVSLRCRGGKCSGGVSLFDPSRVCCEFTCPWELSSLKWFQINANFCCLHLIVNWFCKIDFVQSILTVERPKCAIKCFVKP